MSLMVLYERWATSRARTHAHTLPREITEDLCVSRVRFVPRDGPITGGRGELNFPNVIWDGTDQIMMVKRVMSRHMTL